jgi:hypothetical protein
VDDRVFGLRIAQRDPQLAPLRLWRWSRTTAWRRVKSAMAVANIAGACAMPKGLQHAFGVNDFQCNVPPRPICSAIVPINAVLAEISAFFTACFAEINIAFAVNKAPNLRIGCGEWLHTFTN